MGRIRQKLRELEGRLDAVIIENLSWERCLRIYDGPETFFFCDPPYVGTKTHAYGMWSIDNLTVLLEALKNAKGKWLLTINDRPDVRRVLKGFKVKRMERARGLNIKNGAVRFVELAVTK